ncbi:MAG: SMC-Scp complex subunit ScpB [Candidatus Obscuribacterales bacterium]|nr:SMC-Scp complex subunit ScpB [Candidatus Obscuribacterales bacterium]
MSLKAKIESVLFLTEKPVRAQAIARIVNEDVQLVRKAILDLIQDYEARDGALEIADDDGYIIQVKDQYSSIIDEFLPMELPLALLRTLSAIAIKQPVAQADIIKIRGAGAYDHIKELLQRELINKKEDGRSPLLTTTKQFQDYFRLTQDAKSLRTELRKSDRKKAQPDSEESTTFDATPAEDGESERLVVQLTLDDEANAGSIEAERESSVSMVDIPVAEPGLRADDNTPAVTIAPAAVEAAMESMADGSGDLG